MKNKVIAVVVAVFLLLPLLVTGTVRAEVPVPTNFEAYGYGNYMMLEWDYPSSAKAKNLTFQIFEYDYKTKKWILLGDDPNLQVSIQNPSPGKHVYKVRAKYEGTTILPTVYSKFSEEDAGYILSKPTGLDVSISKFGPPVTKGSPGVTIKWNKVTDKWATHVGIYSKRTGEKKYHLIGKAKKSSTSFIDILAQSNTEYTYAILLMRQETGKKTDYSDSITQNGTVLTYPDHPKNFKAVGKGNDVILTWDRQTNCDGIAVYEKTSSGILGWKLVKQMSNMVIKLTIKNKTPGKYTYLVAAYNKSGNSPGAPIQTAYVLKKPGGLKAEAFMQNQIELKYDPIDKNATDINVYMSTDGSTFALIGSVDAKKSFIAVRELKENTKYYFKITAARGENESPESEVVSAKTAGGISAKVITLKPGNQYMTVNGKKQEIDPGRGTKPVIIPKWGRTVVPIRAIVEALGGTIEWDGVARKVTIKFNGNIVELWIDNPRARVNGQPAWIDENNHDVRPIIVNDRTMLPLRFVAESLGCEVEWDGKTRTITIKFPAK